MKNKIIIIGICVLMINASFLSIAIAQKYNDFKIDDEKLDYTCRDPIIKYDIENLGVLVGGTWSSASDINDTGIVAVNAEPSDGSEEHAAVYDGEFLIDIGNVGYESSVWGINNVGQVVGNEGEYQETATCVIWNQSDSGDWFVSERLGTLSGGTRSNAYDITDDCIVVGASDIPTSPSRAFIWNDGMMDIGAFWDDDNAESCAYAINEFNHVVGYADLDETLHHYHAFIWQDGCMYDLGVPTEDYYSSCATDINNIGQVVGWSWGWSADYPLHAFLWQLDVTDRDIDVIEIISLGTLGGYSRAFGINNLGHIVGYSYLSDGRSVHAFVWEDGAITDINNLIPEDSGWELESAYDINDAGQIVGCGKYNGDSRAYLLTPIERPHIIINFAGNPADLGGPFWRPPGEIDILDEEEEGIWRDGYYTNDSRQNEDWIYINCNVTDDDGVDEVWLHWLNGTTWNNNTWQFINTDGDLWEFNSSGNITTNAGHDYSFDVLAIDSLGNTNLSCWKKTGVGGGLTRRFVQLNCNPESILYKPFYLYESEPYTFNIDRMTADRLHRDQGADGSTTDTGYLKSRVPDDIVEYRWCNSFIAYWFNDDCCIESFTLDKIYYHVWFSSKRYQSSFGMNGSNRIEPIVDSFDEYMDVFSDSKRSVIYYDNDDVPVNNTYLLHTLMININPTFFYTDNNIYQLSVIFQDYWLAFPSAISNRSFTSFILLNVPDNDTLNSSYYDTDDDCLTDWTELYITYTNPFLADTDNDGATDYEEVTGEDHGFWNSDPNDYTNTTDWRIMHVDIDRNGIVDVFDLNLVMAHFGCEVGTGCDMCDRCDVNNDGVVDPFDSNEVMAYFGT